MELNWIAWEICSVDLAESNLKQPILAVLPRVLIWCDSTNKEFFQKYVGKKEQSMQQY